MLGAPLLWAGASPVLVHNLVLMAGFALTGWTTALVIRKWTGSWLAAIGSGSLVAFNSFSLTRLPQIQDLHLEFFPLALLRARPPARRAAPAAGAGARRLVRAAVADRHLRHGLHEPVARGGGARPPVRLDRRTLPAGLAARRGSGGRCPRWRWRRSSCRITTRMRRSGLGRSLEETRRYSAELTDYFAAAGRIHFDVLKWSRPYFQGDALFPGFIGLAARRCRRRRGRPSRRPRAHAARHCRRGVCALVRTGISAIPLAVPRLTRC